MDRASRRLARHQFSTAIWTRSGGHSGTLKCGFLYKVALRCVTVQAEP